MSESDSSIPKKVSALIDAFEEIRKQAGPFSPLDLAFYSWVRKTNLDTLKCFGEPDDAGKEVLATASKFVESVDRAVCVFNAIPVSVLEPLSIFTGRERWDQVTRRILRALQNDVFFLRDNSVFPNSLLSRLGHWRDDEFDEWQEQLMEYSEMLRKKIIDLQTLPTQTFETKGSLVEPQSTKLHLYDGDVDLGLVELSGLTKLCTSLLPQGKVQGTLYRDEAGRFIYYDSDNDDKSIGKTCRMMCAADAFEVALKANDFSVARDELIAELEKIKHADNSQPPEYDAGSTDWILSESLCKLLNIKATTISDYRKARKCGEDKHDKFGKWNRDCVGTFRRNVNKKHGVAYYRPLMSETYKAKLTYAESQNPKKI
jgi:hypothetical protein